MSLTEIWAATWQNQQNGIFVQRRLRSAWASAQSDQSSLSAWRKLGFLATRWAPSEDSDQTWRTPRLIWVFAERTVILLVLSWGGSVIICTKLRQWKRTRFKKNWCQFPSNHKLNSRLKIIEPAYCDLLCQPSTSDANHWQFCKWFATALLKYISAYSS